MSNSKAIAKEHCEHCGHTIYTYKRRLTEDMVRVLLILYVETLARKIKSTEKDIQRTDINALHIQKIISQSPYDIKICAEAPRLRHWGFIHQYENRSGYWVLNLMKAHNFIQGGKSAPKFLHIKEGAVVGEDRAVKITGVLNPDEISKIMSYLPKPQLRTKEKKKPFWKFW